MIAGVILAAGSSERFGTEKLLRVAGGRALVCHAVANCMASSMDSIVVVAGAHDAELETTIRAAFPNQPRLVFAHNPEPGRGQMSSLKIGLCDLPAAATAAAIFLGDMPLVTTGIIEHLLAVHRRSGRFVVPVSEGRWCHPRIIPAARFADFHQLGDDEKGSVVFERYPNDVELVEVGEPWNYLDVDTPQDLVRIETILGS